MSTRSLGSKRERAVSPSTITPSSTTLAPANRQRNESETPTTSLTMPLPPAAVNISDNVLKTYQQMMLPQKAISFLFGERLHKTLQKRAKYLSLRDLISEDEVIEEFRRFIGIKVFTVDENAVKISPTPFMDEMWHTAILDTRFYAELQKAVGVTLHHRPSGASDEEYEEREIRLAAMKALYKAFYHEDPLDQEECSRRYREGLRRAVENRRETARILPSTMVIFVTGGRGKTYSLLVNENNDIFEVKLLIEERANVPVEQQRLVFAGTVLENDKTMQEYSVTANSTLHLILLLVGC